VVLLHTYLGDNMSDWFNWTNFFYLAGIMIAGGATFVGLKYKKLVDEIKEVFKVLQEAYEDGKLDNDERKKIMKEVLDVLGALMKIAWK
jgi:flagellar motor component MotA